MEKMEKMSQVLEKALEEILGPTNLPTRYPDFQALTRELVRKLADKLVLVDRKTWNEVHKAEVPTSKGLAEVTERYKAHNDLVEASLSKRESVPPAIQPSYHAGRSNHARR